MTAAVVLADSWGWHHGDVGIGWWIVMMLGMLLFWGAIIALVIWALRGGISGIGQRPPQDPLDILKRRLADGSITVEEYDQRRAKLEASATHSP